MKIWVIRNLLGKEIGKILFLSIFVGIIWFVVEYSFVYVLQAFLVVIGAIDRQQTFLPEWFDASLGVAVGGIVIFGICRWIVQMLRNYLSLTINQRFIRRQRELFADYTLNNGDTQRTSEISTVFSEVIIQSSQYVSRISDASVSATTVLLLLSAAFYLAPRELVTAFTLLIILVLPLRVLNKSISGFGENLVANWRKATTLLINGMRSYFLLKVHRSIEEQRRMVKNAIAQYEVNYRSYYKIYVLKQGYPQFVGIVIVSMVTYVSIQYFNTPALKLLSFFFIFIRLAQATSDVNVMMGDVRLYQSAILELKEWNEKYNASKSKNQSMGTTLNIGPIVNISAHNLSIGYGNTVIQSDINFHLASGDVLLISGESGSGKSTLIATLLGILDPMGGEIKINGQLVSSLNDQSDYFEQIGYVGPEPFLFHGSVASNLVFGSSKDFSENEMWETLEKCNAKVFVNGLPKGLGEEILEHAQLSTGQKQRISFARALLRQPKLLILDEATANLDVFNEQTILNRLRNELPSSIFMVVSHRQTLEKIATKFIQLEGGTKRTDINS